MNIFYLDPDPALCAQYHCNKHVVKMIVEYGQILSTAHRVLDGHYHPVQVAVLPKFNPNKDYSPSDTFEYKIRTRHIYNHPDKFADKLLYKATHINHPSVKWARANITHYDWLYSLLVHLESEYELRYVKTSRIPNKKHHSIRNSGLLAFLSTAPRFIRQNFNYFSTPPMAMPECYQYEGNVVQSYRDYYNAEKQHFAIWPHDQTPYWYKTETENRI